MEAGRWHETPVPETENSELLTVVAVATASVFIPVSQISIPHFYRAVWEGQICAQSGLYY